MNSRLRSSTIVAALIASLSLACDDPSAVDAEPPEAASPEVAAEAPPQELDLRWLPQDEEERFQALESQLGGFSEAMRHTAYRYNELYWAGVDRNWEYAEYQLEKLADAVELGTIRRPDRAASAELFLTQDVPRLMEAIEAGDGDAYDEQFDAFTRSCNTCHAMEDVEFIKIKEPPIRTGPTAPLPQ